MKEGGVEAQGASFKCLNKLSLFLSVLVFLIGALVLGGSFFHVPILVTVQPGLASMKVNSATALMLAALSLWLLQQDVPGIRSRIGTICAVIVGMIGLLTLTEYWSGIDLRIDDLLLATPPSESNNPFPSRMSPITAFCFVCAAIALLRLDIGWKRLRISEIANAALLEASVLGLMGYVYGVPSLYRIGSYNPLAIHTGFAFLILGVGIFAARPERGLILILARRTPSSVLLWRMLLAAIVVPLVFGWLRLKGQQAGYFDTRFGLALYATSMITSFVALLWWMALWIDRAEMERQEAEKRTAADLHAMTRLNEVANRCIGERNELHKCLVDIVETAIAITGADKGNVQLLDSASGALTIAAQRGFEEPFLKFFANVRNDASACGSAMQSGESVIVEDVTRSQIFACQTSLSVLLDAGVRAVQSTPLLSSTGNLLGMISTYFRIPHRPSERELRLIDLLARQAADYLERKQTEDQRERLLAREQVLRAESERVSRIKDEFLATISHELRTPLTAILGWSQLLGRGDLSQAQAERAMETIQRNAKAQLKLIEDLLDVSRIISGKLRVECRPVELHEIAAHAIEVILPTTQVKGVQLKVDLQPGIPTVSGDPDRLQQVIWNLLSNAVKFTPKGGWVRITLDNPPEGVRLVVEDSGEGIEPEFAPYIFDRFSQADSSMTRSHDGLGLGLAIVRHLVEAQGGYVYAWSAGKGKGAKVTVILPAQDAPAKTPPASQPVSAERRPLYGCRLLVVDDRPDELELFKTVLRAEGAEVISANSAASALDWLREDPPDVLVSDIAMPEQDGYELIRKMRKLPQAKSIPAIALTAYARIEDRERALASGFQAYVSKPVEPERLIEVVTRVAQRAGTRRLIRLTRR